MHFVSVRTTAALAMALIFVSGCLPKSGSTRISPEESRSAGAILEEARTALTAGDAAAAETSLRALTGTYPNYARLDEAWMALGDLAMADKRAADAALAYDHVVDDHPNSNMRPVALVRAAEAHAALGDELQAAERLLGALELPLEPATKADAIESLRRIAVNDLSGPQLQSLIEKHPKSILAKETTIVEARREYARGNYERSYKLLAQYVYQYPEDAEVTGARRLLAMAGERRQAVGSDTLNVDPDKIGLVLPMTGELAVYGRMFTQGVEIAVAEHNAAHVRKVKVATADSRGNPYDAVAAVRSLALEEGVVGIVGSLFTVPTIAAAIESNAWRVPLVSPSANADRLPQLGPFVFESKMSEDYEVATVARVAVRDLLLERVAIIAPARGQRSQLGEFFREEVARFGGRVVAYEVYNEGATDFREQIERVREAAPEAIFIPGRVEELLVMLPQIKFYDLQVQLLGMSNWNSPRLLRLSRDELEGALFPMETHVGRTPAAYERVATALREKGSAEVEELSVDGYFAAKLLLATLAQGAISRAEVQQNLESATGRNVGNAGSSLGAIPLLKVESGRAIPFRFGSGG